MFDLFFLFQLLAFMACLGVYNKLLFPYKYFAPFLFSITTYQLIIQLGLINSTQSQTWSYNIFTSIEFIFYSLILHGLLKKSEFKSFLYYAIIFTLFCTLVYIIMLKKYNSLNTYIFSLQAFVIITACCMYYFYKVRNARNEVLILKDPTFWLYTGLLLYYLGEFLFFASYAFIPYKGSADYLMLYTIVINVSNIILYSCLIKLFLCFRQTRI
jgi:hypothetical protein